MDSVSDDYFNDVNDKVKEGAMSMMVNYNGSGSLRWGGGGWQRW